MAWGVTAALGGSWLLWAYQRDIFQMQGTHGSSGGGIHFPFGAGGRDKMHSSVYRCVAWVGLWVLIVANAARAEAVLNFQPSPISGGVPEFIYTGGTAGEALVGGGGVEGGGAGSDAALPTERGGVWLERTGGFLLLCW